MVGQDHRQSSATRRDCFRWGATVAAGLVAGCGGLDDALDTGTMPAGVNETPAATTDSGWTAPQGRPAGEYDTEVLVENLAIPWDVAFAPTGEMFITERTGRVVALDGDEARTVAEPDAVIDAEAVAPGVKERSWLVEGGEGGLLGVAVHPSYPDPALVYTYVTTDTGDGTENRVVAFDAANSDGPWTVIKGIPAATFHNGGRIEFGPDGHLWVATGDADPAVENADRTRDPGSLAGKILRVTPEGDPAPDNPAVDGADPRVYTYGHRNPQGLAWLPDGTPLVTEHGPGGGDEVSVLRAGADHGWPVARAGDDFADYPETEYRPPVASASSWAPSGAVFYTGGAVPSLQNRLLVGGLISQQVIAVTLSTRRRLGDHDHRHDAGWLDDTYRAAHDLILQDSLGRVRHLEQGPDGGLYAVTSNRDGRASGAFPTDRDDVLVRITPGR